MDLHAQHEIRQYATVIGNEIVARWCPTAWAAFLEYWFNSLTFSDLEVALLTAIIGRNDNHSIEIAERAGWLLRGADGLRRHRERNEFEAKLKTLGLVSPWS
jgi:thymidylate synthase (FAD)